MKYVILKTLVKYWGYGLQKILVKYLEERAREKGISNIIAEVTFGNVYSLRNLNSCFGR